MQRGAIREEQEQLRSENQRAIDDEHWVLDIPTSTQSKYIVFFRFFIVRLNFYITTDFNVLYLQLISFFAAAVGFDSTASMSLAMANSLPGPFAP